MRAFTTEHKAALAAETTHEGWLLAITPTGLPAVYLNTIGANYSYGGHTYLADPGFVMGRVRLTDGSDPGALEVEIPVSEDGPVAPDNVTRGLYAGATVELRTVDYENDHVSPPLGYEWSVGRASITDDGNASFDIRAGSRMLRELILKKIGPICTANWGGSRCGVNAATYTDAVTVASVASLYEFTVTGSSRTNGFFVVSAKSQGSDGGDKARIGLRFLDSGGDPIGSDIHWSAWTTTGDWERTTLSDPVPGTAESARIYMHMLKNAGSRNDAHIDDIKVDYGENALLVVNSGAESGTTGWIIETGSLSSVDANRQAAGTKMFAGSDEVIAYQDVSLTATNGPASGSGTTVSDGFFDNGAIKFTSGDNIDRAYTVRRWTQSTGRVLLWEPLRAPLVVGDTASMHAGCDKMRTTCHLKFDNVARFQGFADLPADDAKFAYEMVVQQPVVVNQPEPPRFGGWMAA